MSDQASNLQSSTTDTAAQAMLDSGVMDSILGSEDVSGQPEIETEPPIAAEEVEDGQGVEDPENAEEVEEQSEADEVEQEEDESVQEEQEHVELETVDQLAEALEVSKDDLLDTLQIPVVIDGQEQSVTLKEAQAGYQKDADYRRKTGELAEQRRAVEAKAQEQSQQVELQHTVAAQMLRLAENQLVGELNSAEMASLRDTDPMAWTAKYADIQQRQQSLAQAKQQAANAYMQNRHQVDAQIQQANQQKLADESEALLAAMPDFKEQKPKIDSFLTEKLGFTNDDLTSVNDHRLILLAHKAMLYDQGQQRATEVKKKVKAAPKMQKPAASKPKPANSKRQKLTVAKKNLRKSGHIRDAASAIENLL